MKLRRLTVRNFRKLAGPVHLDAVGDGLTLVSGCNEEGKSTLLAALKHALFEHHKVGGAVRERMTPHGGNGAVPEVEVEFELAGERWALRKAFGRGGAELVGPQGGRSAGDAAEERLRELLSFQPRSGRADARPEHHGLAALFWIDQGTTFAGFDTYAAVARDRLSAAVAGELGALVGGHKAAALLARARERCNEFWTATFKERGALKQAQEVAAALEADAAQLRARVAEVAVKEERLERLREERRRAAATDALGAAAARRDEAQRRLQAIDALKQRVEIAGERWKAGQARLAQARAAAVERQRARDALAQDQARQRAALALATERQEELATSAAALTRAEGQAAQARATVVSLEDERRGLEARLDAMRQRDELHRLQAAARKIEAADEEIGSLEAKLAVDPVTAELVAAARQAQQRRDQAAAGLAAVATGLILTPAAGAAPARRDGRPLRTGAQLELTDRTEIELPGWGRMTVLPGGADIAARRSDARASEDALGQALRACGGVASIAAAERRLLDRQALERAVEQARHRRETALAAAGCGAPDEVRQRARWLDGLLAGAASPETTATDRAAPDPSDLARVTHALAAARDAVDRAVRALHAAETLFHDRKIAAKLAEQRAADAARAIEATAAELERDAASRADDALVAGAEEARRACDALAAEFAEVDGVLKRADRETVAARLDLALREIEQLEADGRRREHAIAQLDGELRASGEEGPGERLRQKEDELREATAALARTRKTALAWKLLHTSLDAALSADREALLAPVQQRLDPWLRRLLPEAGAVLDPTSLAPLQLRRAGVIENYRDLSLGTREQIAILVRLGVAQLLAEREGEAPCLILDDPLVYADEGRFETMKAILARAAETLQIIILTCRPRDYFGLDARHLRLEECRTG